MKANTKGSSPLQPNNSLCIEMFILAYNLNHDANWK